MRVAILGFGREGKSLLKFLKKSLPAGRQVLKFKNAKISILDQKFDKNYLKNLSRFDIIFRSPGLPYTLPKLYRARSSGVEVSSATKLFFSLAHPYRKKLIGITGTKGKGTTSTLLTQILRNCGRKVILAGNIGKPMLDILPDIKKADYVILELSSFQIQDLPQSPHIAVVLDVFPDHLDEHKTLREYYESKVNIGRFQRKSDAIFYFANNPLTKKIALKSPAKKFPVYPKENTPKKNYGMAAAVARYLKCSESAIQKAIKNFRGLEHRLELVKTISIRQKSYANVLKNIRMDFVNDSAATNPGATAAAIYTFKEPLILIAGGRSKIHDFSPMTKAIKEAKNLQMVILFGENKREIRDAIRKEFNKSKRTTAAPHIVLKPNLKSALELAYRFARPLVASGYWSNTVVLFSPASASFDQFKNYADRGKTFKKFVRML